MWAQGVLRLQLLRVQLRVQGKHEQGSALTSRFQRVYSSSNLHFKTFHFTLICLHGERLKVFQWNSWEWWLTSVTSAPERKIKEFRASLGYMISKESVCMCWGVIGEGEMGDMETVFSGSLCLICVRPWAQFSTGRKTKTSRYTTPHTPMSSAFNRWSSMVILEASICNRPPQSSSFICID